MRELFIPKSWLSPSLKSVLFDLLAILIIIIGMTVYIIEFKNPLKFVVIFLGIRAFSMGLIKKEYFKNRTEV